MRKRCLFQIVLSTLAFAVVAAEARAEGDSCIVDITGQQSFAVIPDATNSSILFDVAAGLSLPSGTPLVLNGVGWNLVLQAIGDSWLNEAQVQFTDPAAPAAGGPAVTPGMFFGPGNNNNQPMFFVIPTPVKLEFLMQDYLLLPNGLVRMEFGESFDNGPGPDTNWVQGVLFLQARPPCAPGDVNCDEVVDFADVEPFVDALLDPTTLSPMARASGSADVNADGALDGRDVADFVDLLLP